MKWLCRRKKIFLKKYRINWVLNSRKDLSLFDTDSRGKTIWLGKLLMTTFSYSSTCYLLKGSPRVCGAGTRLAGVRWWADRLDSGQASLAAQVAACHSLNMELDLQSIFGLHVHSCTHWLLPRNPPSLRIWAHIRGRYVLVSQERRHWPPAAVPSFKFLKQISRKKLIKLKLFDIFSCSKPSSIRYWWKNKFDYCCLLFA